MGQYKYQTKTEGTKWSAKFRFRDPETGETKVEYKRGFPTRRESKAYEEHFLENLGHEREKAVTEKNPGSHTFYQVYLEYLSSHKREDLKKSTRQTKENVFITHIFPAFKDQDIATITSDDIYAWQTEMKSKLTSAGTPLSGSYLRTVQTQLNSVFNYAGSKGYLSVNPLADIRNMGAKDKRILYWTREEYEKVAQEARVDPDVFCCLEVLYWCGLREGEALALTMNDLNFENRTISVNKTYVRLKGGEDHVGTPKTESSCRVVTMPTFLCDELREYLGRIYNLQPEDRIFRCGKATLIRQFHRFTEQAGLTPIPVHALRHSHVSLLISMGLDIFQVSKRIGHSSIKTTTDIYGHLFDAAQKKIADELDEMRRK